MTMKTLENLVKEKREGLLTDVRTELIQEVEIEENSVLLVVDIQKQYSQHFDAKYLAKVAKWLEENKEKFTEVRLMFDIFRKNGFGDYVPTCVGKYATDTPIFKQYSSTLPHYQFSDSSILKEANKLDIEELYNKPERNTIRLEKGALMQMPTKSLNRSYVQYCFQDFVEIMEQWKEQNKKVYLIGGGVDNCVSLTSMIFENIGVRHEVLRQYCYAIEWCNNFNPEDLSELTERDLEIIGSNETNRLTWDFVRNTNADLQEFLKTS